MAHDWRSQPFRENIVQKINNHISITNLILKTDAIQMENNIFLKSSSENEYLASIARLIVYIKGK